jgi:hypothetical protein
MEVFDDCREDDEEMGSRYCPLDRCERSVFFCLTFCGYVIPPTDHGDRTSCGLADRASRPQVRSQSAQPAPA